MTVLDPLVQDLKTLEEDGVFVPLLGRFVKGTVQVVVADNLGAQSMAGLVESFSTEYRCRFCTATKSDIQTKDVRSGAFTVRTKEVHLRISLLDYHLNFQVTLRGKKN